MLPGVHDAITTDEGGSVLFAFAGRTGFVGDTGVQLLSVTN